MLLAIDTSTAQMGLALYDGTQVVGETLWHSRRYHTVQLAPALSELLARTEVSIASVEALGVALGPGSFTALRVGLALAKGLAVARGLPLIGIPTLDVVAASRAVCELPLAAVLQAGRGRIAVAWYRAEGERWQAEGPAKLTTVEKLAEAIRKPTLVCGELTAAERQRLARKRKNVLLASPAESVRRPALLAELAWQRWKAGEVDEVAPLAPIYLHVGEEIPA
ncbi:MAG: tRNA (adenosine(37)-N6)-threonylcarbamoyltransferase complex dimerization subunit type 1 TsaB [Anaerolineae bacterium]|nr:MAG: tRNA (adenosine(37)-N6)-threonylcarbamoyltransferase complex dimerization subunit type 1 TsaB [Anaerolineae bacterium]